MIRKIIAGLFCMFAAAGCNTAGPDRGDDTDTGEAASELSAREGEPCGGIAGVVCDEGLYCDFPVETECGSGDQQGTCTVPPGACIPVMKAVCGCDGNTYNNACDAAYHGVSVQYSGECK